MPPRHRLMSRHVMAILLVGFCLGYASHRAVHADVVEPPPIPFAQLDTFAQVLSHIERSYVDPVDTNSLIYGAIKGMVDTLDPHSSFLTPDESRAMRNETRGEYVGVGMELGVRDGNITVIAPFEGGPAYEAGIESGDIVVSVDGEGITDSNLHDVIQMLRGELGVPVDLEVQRLTESGPEYRPFTIVRDIIRVQAVSAVLLKPGLGLVRISSFQLGVSDDLVSAIDSLTVDNGDQLDGLILDLRDNPGGLLSEGVAVSDVFLDDGVIVTTEGRDSEENTSHRSRNGTTRYEGRLVVLVNGGTASASEIVAGALQDRGRAELIGTTTFGKGTVQSIIDFADGSGLKLTVARYYSPSHREIHGNGIEPDVWAPAGLVEPDEEATPEGFAPITDGQIQVALDHLR